MPKIQEFSINVCDDVINAALFTTLFHVWNDFVNSKMTCNHTYYPTVKLWSTIVLPDALLQRRLYKSLQLRILKSSKGSGDFSIDFCPLYRTEASSSYLEIAWSIFLGVTSALTSVRPIMIKKPASCERATVPYVQRDDDGHNTLPVFFSDWQ